MLMRNFAFNGGFMGGPMKVQNPMQNQGGPIQEPPMATFPGTADPAPQEQVRSPFNRGPVMGGGFMGGFGGGFGNWGGGFSRPLFPQFGGFMGSPFGGGFSPFGGQFGGGFSPSRQMMGGYMGNLMQPFNFGFQPPRTQQAPQPQQPQQPQMPGPNIPPMLPPGFDSVTGGGN